MSVPRAIAAALDRLLELTVIGSFSRIGPAVRSRLDAWTPPPPGALDGRTALVTGPTSGLGRATAEALADLGARVILLGRDRSKLADVRDALVARRGEDRYPIVVADLGSLADIRRAVDAIRAGEARLDVLVDNAGAIFPGRELGPDGIERTLALMVVAPFALTSSLLPLLEDSGGRVIAVTSGGQYTQPLDLDDLELAGRPWSGPRAYARAKRAQVALVREWARRTAGGPVTFTAMHPGWADTPGLEASLPGFRRLMGPLLRTPAEGIDTIVWLAADPGAAGPAPSGRLFLDRRSRPFDRAPQTRLSTADRARLWDRIVELARIADPAPERA